MFKKRKFEIISVKEMLKTKEFENCSFRFREAFKLHFQPRRATKNSAAYDLYSPIEIELKPGEIAKIPTGFKIKMPKNEAFFIYIRSSYGAKDIILPAGVNIIDADYYNNPSNEGHFFICIKNNNKKPFKIEQGDRIAQGVFQKYYTCREKIKTKRQDGFGSTGK